MKKWWGALLGLTIAMSLTWLAGENPAHIAMILFRSAFGSSYDLGLTLFYTTPLIFTGLAVAVALRGGLFNIGAEGQLTMAAAAATGCGVLLPHVPFPAAVLLALLAAVLTGMAWGGFAGWMRAYRGSHEVIVTILMNFVAASLASWFVLSVIPNPNSQNPESAMVGAGYQFSSIDPFVKWFPDTGLSLALPVAILLAIVVWIVLQKTAWGFEIRALGQNPDAARRAGVPVEKRWFQLMALSGGLAAGVALSEILGHSGQFKIGFSPDYGFIGVAVALLARGNPLGVLVSAFFMAALHKGASDLDLETATITRDFSKILQALIILGISLRGWRGFRFWRPR